MDIFSPLANKAVELVHCELSSPLLTSARSGYDGEAGENKLAVLRDARKYMTKLHIYESVFNPTLTGELEVQDDMNLSSIVPLIGLETLRVKFKIYNPQTKQYRTYPDGGGTLPFAVYNQTARVPSSQAAETYRLGLTSRELISSAEKRFSRAFTNQRVEEVINTILTEYIRTPKRKELTALAPDGARYFELTSNPFNFIAPYISPLGAIKLATLQAYATGQRSNYFFYETLDGFYFRSLQQMIQLGKQQWTKNPVSVRRRMSGTSQTKQSFNELAAEQIDIVTNFDFLYAVSQGYFASATIGVDVLSGQYRVTPTSIADADYTSRQRLNANPLYPSGLAKTANPSAKVFLMPTTSISAANTALRNRDSSISDNFLEQTLARRSRELIELQTVTIRVKLAGAPNINVGTVIYIEIPETLKNGVGGTQLPSFKDLRSGLYLILAVKHTIINNGGGSYAYETTFEACSDSIG